MSGRSGRGNRHRHHHHGPPAREPATSLAADSPVLALFRATAVQLNARHDRHERLVKMSRDITIESKRIIFLLHSAISKEDAVKAVAEADERLNKLVQGAIKSVALELEDSPSYLHCRAVSPGYQEFIEAKTLCHLLKHDSLPTCSDVQKELVYNITDTNADTGEVRERAVGALLPPVDFVLGVADLTGELMRRTINSLAGGDTGECFRSCQLVRDLYAGFLRVYGGGKEVARKMPTIRANVQKVEAAVYALRVRGGEAPPALLLPAPAPHDEHVAAHSDDEGYY